MPTIELRFDYAVHPNRVFAALTEQEHLAGWWTEACCAMPKVASTATFEFPHCGEWVTFLVESLLPGRVVQWRCTDSSSGMRDWRRTIVRFEIEGDDYRSSMKLVHRGWRADATALESYESGWRTHLGESLKAYLEAGRGMPILRAADPLDVPREVVAPELEKL